MEMWEEYFTTIIEIEYNGKCYFTMEEWLVLTK